MIAKCHVHAVEVAFLYLLLYLHRHSTPYTLLRNHQNRHLATSYKSFFASRDTNSYSRFSISASAICDAIVRFQINSYKNFSCRFPSMVC